MKFQEPEVVEMGLAEELIQIEVGRKAELPPEPQPSFDSLSVYLPEEE